MNQKEKTLPKGPVDRAKLTLGYVLLVLLSA